MLRRLCALGSSCLLGCACAGSSPSPELPPPDHCPTVQVEPAPGLMLADDVRAALAASEDRGAIAVRYETRACELRLEVLSGCGGEGSHYDYRSGVQEVTVVAGSARQLLKKLPLGTRAAAGQLEGAGLRADALIVGQLVLAPAPDLRRASLTGPDCARATHVVTRIDVGGFTLTSGPAARLSTPEPWFRTGVQLPSGVERLRLEGSPSRCAEAKASGERQALCAVPLRLGLTPLVD
ncbi:MAG: hypothetical protein KC766_21575 [Myxococcales bacterium]|nr:hypothetical protein [Myxococcales bacterium]